MVRLRYVIAVCVLLVGVDAVWAQEELIAPCMRECSSGFCIPGDFTPGGLQQCFRECHNNCEARIRRQVVRPKYFILELIYAPPGCTSSTVFRCPGQSSLTYANGSSTGSTTSVTSSFQSGTSLTIDHSFSIFGINLFETSATSGFSSTAETTNSLTVSKSESEQETLSSGSDDVDHNQDVFVLLINPAVVIESLEHRAIWNMGFDGPSPVTAHVTVGELRDPRKMRRSVFDTLVNGHGLTTTDFNTMLAQDPFSNGSTAIDPARFARTRWTVPYEPPVTTPTCAANGNCPCLSFTKQVTNDLLREQTTTSQSQYTTSLSTHVDFLDLTSGDNFTFTTTSSASSRQGSTSSAETTITCPSPTYTGSIDIDIYWDTLYRSFMYAQNHDGIAHRGRALDENGEPLRQEEIALTFDGATHYTITDNEGRYRFTGAPTEASHQTGQLVIRKMKKTVPLSTPSEVRIQTP